MQGSGVLLKIADIAFVLTAGHVLKGNRDMEMLIGPMAKGSRTIKAHDGQFAFSDDIADVDVGFIRLSDEAAKTLSNHKSFARMSDLDLRTSNPCSGRYCILGFPQQINTTDYVNREISALHFHYMSSPIILPSESKPQVTLWLEVTNGIVTLSDSEAATEGEVRMPELNGISGCGMWRLYGTEDRIDKLEQWDPSWIRLVGIEHAWVRGKRVKGTFVQHAIDMIENAYPDLRTSIRLSR
jgi:hypothetical protein